MALGRLSYGQARACADSLGKSAAGMDDAFNRLRNEMSMLQREFQSAAASQLYQTYNGLEAKLNSFPNKVRDFQVFLNKAVDQYEADEAALNKEVL